MLYFFFVKIWDWLLVFVIYLRSKGTLFEVTVDLILLFPNFLLNFMFVPYCVSFQKIRATVNEIPLILPEDGSTSAFKINLIFIMIMFCHYLLPWSSPFIVKILPDGFSRHSRVTWTLQWWSLKDRSWNVTILSAWWIVVFWLLGIAPFIGLLTGARNRISSNVPIRLEVFLLIKIHNLLSII